jgi:hypothetical protein
MLLASIFAWLGLAEPVLWTNSSIQVYLQSKRTHLTTDPFTLAGARGIEPRSRVLETLILAVVLCPYIWLGINVRYKC